MGKIKDYLLLHILLAAFAYPLKAQNDYHQYYNKSIRFYRNRDFRSFLAMTHKADSLRPNHPTLLYNLAAGLALNGQKAAAMEVLRKRIAFYAKDDFDRDKDFNALKNEDGYRRLLAGIKRLTHPKKSSKPAFSLSKKNFHPEGITFHKSNGRFLLGDIRSGKIYSYEADGTGEKLFIDLSESGYWSVMGMAFDAQSPQKLWVTTSALPEFAGYDSTLEGQSAVLMINAATVEIEKEFRINGKHLFGDLAAAPDGQIYVTDSRNPVVYTIEPDSEIIHPLAKDDRWWNLQGVAVSDDNRYLFIADYVTGIFVLNLVSRKIKPLLEKNYISRGTDGLYLMDKALVFIQNGTYPKRIGVVKIDQNGRGDESTITFTDQALDGLDEPTLGVIVGQQLFYIANSPWAYYDEYHNPISKSWPDIHIWKLQLGK